MTVALEDISNAKKIVAARRSNGAAQPPVISGLLPPHDLGAEVAVLSAILLKRDALDQVAEILKPEHFYNAANGHIYEAARTLAIEQSPIDVVTVASWLRDQGRLQHAGGTAYLASIIDATPAISNVASHAEIVLRKARIRRVIAECQRLSAEGYGDVGDVDEWLSGSQAALSNAAEAPVKPKEQRVTLPDRARRLGYSGPRIRTGFASLDLATRGGFPIGRRCFLVGAPGSKKTWCTAALAHRMTIAGHHVAIHAADEEADAILVRLGQMEGFDRHELEAGKPEVREQLAARLESHFSKLLLVDQDADRMDLDDTAEALIRAANGAPAMLAIDSIQTVRIRGGAVSRTRREELDEVVRRIKLFSARGLLIFATSEMNRAGYRSKDAADNASDIASAAETRSIEYAATTMLALRCVPDHDELVDVTMPKNRLGKRVDFRIELDFERSTMSEVTVDDAQPKPTAAFDSLKEKIIAIVRHEPLRSRSAVVERCGVAKSRGLQAIKELLEEGRLAEVGGEFRAV